MKRILAALALFAALAAAGNGLYGGPITLTSYVWEQVGYACPGTICTGATPTASSAFGVKFGAGKFQ